MLSANIVVSFMAIMAAVVMCQISVASSWTGRRQLFRPTTHFFRCPFGIHNTLSVVPM
jgi:hypothetical protein